MSEKSRRIKVSSLVLRRVATKIFEGFGEALFKECIMVQEPVSIVHYIRLGTCIKRPTLN